MTELTIAQSNPVAPTSRAGKTRTQYRALIQAKRTHICLFCKKEYVSKRRHLTEGSSYCSRECAYAMKAFKAQAPYTKVVFNNACCSVACTRESGRIAYRLAYQAEVDARPMRQCKQCSKTYKAEHGASEFCSKTCSTKGSGHNASRAKAFGVDRGYFNERRILVRDKWTCKLCGIKTPEKLRGKNLPNSPEIDHIIPLSKGGVHRQHNLQCACRQCNNAKGNKPLGQLIMIGFGDIR